VDAVMAIVAGVVVSGLIIAVKVVIVIVIGD
jgi:hypothetical protein